MSTSESAARSFEEIVEDLERQIKQLVKASNVERDDNLFDLGVESLMLVDIKDAIREKWGVNLKFSDFFSNFTIAALATLIDRLQSEERV